MIYAVPDIHGHARELDRALALIEADGGAEAPVVFLGDLCDRGPDTKGVIDRLIAGRAAGRDWTVLRGNHDQMFLDFLSDPNDPRAHTRSGISWLHDRVGGIATLASYGVTATERHPNGQAAARAIPEAHKAFLDSLPYYLERAGKLFVHAGIHPRLPMTLQDPIDMMWIRETFLDYTDPHPWLIVHGHTALDAPQHFGNRIDLDGGAGYGRPLAVAVFDGPEEADCFLLGEGGRAPLIP